jgi:zeaxanthin glucosyltransferase
MFHVRDLEAKARSEGLEFRGLEDSDFPPGTLENFVARLAELSGMASLKFAIRCECRISELILKHGPEAVRAAGVDALLVDQNSPAAASVAQYLDLPFLSMCTSLPLNREPYIPPTFTGWQYSDSSFAFVRNALGNSIASYFVRPIHETVNAWRERWKLKPLRTPDDSFSPRAQIAQMPREFDFPRQHLSGSFHYLGPWFDSSHDAVPFPYERLDGRPLIYGSIGTLQSPNHGFFSIMALACSKLNAQLVLTLGKPGTAPVPEFPGNPITVRYAPQTALLARAAATITHAGMNTTQQSLYFGAPLVAIPITHDQPAIAARLARTGAGIVIQPDKLTAEGLRDALCAVLRAGGSYRAAASRMRDAIRRSAGRDGAADIAEKLIRS